jgi:predicted dehydrogenase
MPKSYRVAVIGRTGRGDYGHGIDVVWQAFDNTEVVAVADESEKGRAAVATRLKAKNAYADYREMLDKERPQIVSVCPRWLDCHRDMVVACAEAGAHVFMEKPMCRTLAEADEMVTACERHHVKLALAHQTHYSPRILRIKDVLAAGRIGDLLELRGRGKEDAARGGGEDLMVLGVHIMDLMRIFAGDPRWCFGNVYTNEKPVTRAEVRSGAEGIGPLAGDRIFATYGFDKGIQGSFATVRDRRQAVDTTRTVAGSRFGLHLLGSRGMVTMTTGSLPAVYLYEDPSWSTGQSKAAWLPITSAGVEAPEPLKDGSAHAGNVWIIKDLIEAIEKDRQPLCGMYDGRWTLEMVFGVYESHRVKGPVELPLKTRKHPLELLE